MEDKKNFLNPRGWCPGIMRGGRLLNLT